MAWKKLILVGPMEVNVWTADSNGLTEMCGVIPEINGQAPRNKMARWLSPPVYSSGPEMPIEVRGGESVVLPEEGTWTDLEPAYETVMLDEKDAFLWIEIIWTKVSLTRLSPSLMDLEFRGTLEARGWVYLSQELENAMVVGLVLGTAPDRLFRQVEQGVVWAACQRAEMEMERMEVRVELEDREKMRRPLRTMSTSQEIKGECAMARRRTFLEERPLGIEPPREVPGGKEVSLPAANEGWHQVADWVGVELAENMVYLVTKVEWRANENGEWNPDLQGHVSAEGRLYMSEDGWREFGVRLASGEDPLSMFEGAWQFVWRAGFEFADPGMDDVTANLRVAMVGSFELPSENVRMRLPPFLLERLGGLGLVRQAVADLASLTYEDAMVHREYYRAFLEMGPFSGEQKYEVLRILHAVFSTRPRAPIAGSEVLWGVIRREISQGMVYVDDLYRLLGKGMATEEGINDQQSGGNQGTNGDGERNEGSARDRESTKLEETREDGKDLSTGESLGKAGGSKRGPQENREGGNDVKTSPQNSAGTTPKKTKVLDTRRKLAEIQKRTAEFKARLIEQMMAGDEEDPQDAGSREGRRIGQDEARYEGKHNSHKGTPNKKGKDKDDPPTEGMENAMTPPAIDSGTSRLPATPKATGACDGLWSLRERVLGWFDPEGTPKAREKQRESKEGEGTSATGEAGACEDGLKRVVTTLTRTLNKNQGYLANAKRKLTFDGANITEFLIDYENLAALLKWTEEEKMEHLGQHVSLSLGRDIMAIVASSGSWKETRNDIMRKYLKAEKMATEAELAAVQRKNYATYNDFLRAFTLVALRIPGVTNRIMSKYFLRQFSEFDKDKILSAYQQTSKFEYMRDVDFSTVTDLAEKTVVTGTLALLKEGEVIDLTGKTGDKVKKGIESLHKQAQVSKPALPPQEAVVPAAVANRGFGRRDPANEQCKYCTMIGHFVRACPRLNHDIERQRCSRSLKGEILGPRGERVNWNSPGGMRRAVILLNNLEIAAVEVEPIAEIVWDQPKGSVRKYKPVGKKAKPVSILVETSKEEAMEKEEEILRVIRERRAMEGHRISDEVADTMKIGVEGFLTPEETRYSQFKKEVLAILYCLKTFHAYLFGRRFILRIDPINVVGALKNYKPIDPTVGRWIGFIWQFDYKVERIAGLRNRADGLSRVCITPEGIEDAEPIDAFLEYEGGTLVVDNEMADPTITTGQLLIQTSEKGAPPVVAELREGPATTVRRKEEKDSWGAEVGAREELMAMAVEGGRDVVMTLAETWAQKECQYLVNLTREEQGMAGMVATYCQTCLICQERSVVRVYEPLRPTRVLGPGHLVHLDLAVMPISTDGFRYILDARDNLSGYVEAVALKKKTGKVVADWVEDFYLRHPFVRKFIADNGTKFFNQEVLNRLKTLCVPIKITEPYHPEANAPVERGHRTLKNTIAKLAADNLGSWPRFLKQAVFAENMTPKRTTGCIPAELWYGREIDFSIEALVPTWNRLDDDPHLSTEELITARCLQVARNEEALEEVVNRVTDSRMRDKARWDQVKNIRKEPLQVGEKVLVRNSALESTWPEEGHLSRQAGESSSRKRKLYVGFDHNLVVNRGGRKQGTRGPSPLREGELIVLPSESDTSSEEERNPGKRPRLEEDVPVEFIDLTSDEEEDEVTTPTREERGRGEQPGEKKDKWIEEFGPEFNDWFDQWGTILRYQWIMQAREKLGRGEDLSPTTFFTERTLL
ncbi:hypothetical protein CBR_g64828 [Chara braunii]|uniref:Integrase catalytic domain-containing protein n=1 Tax=Chara braunii TaxID=69332 RepID=A0A388K920_CHABU|nr:hypothetical protein CBR_g64828 [Chara braunii]|eukprot:GBG66558.1 hypothetical protein CBR_g64828 [Chara braunii]